MNASHAIFAPAQAQVMRWLFGQPQRKFHVQELLRLTALGSASLQREIARLLGAGLVVEERVGNLRRVQANAASPLFDALTSIVHKTVGIGPSLQAALEPLARQIQLAILFGSVAKGTETASSDIDVLVVSDALSLHDIMQTLLPLEKTLGRPVSVKLYKPHEFAQRKAQPDSLVQRVLQSAHTVLLGAMD